MGYILLDPKLDSKVFGIKASIILITLDSQY